MINDNKATLTMANAAIVKGDNEGFLAFCTEDTEWIFVGDRVLQGKEAVRQYMTETYIEPPEFEVEKLVAEGDTVIALGKIRIRNEKGVMTGYSYCDVWQFRDGKMAGLKAFVLPDK